MYLRVLVFIVLLLGSVDGLLAQVSQGGKPLAWSDSMAIQQPINEVSFGKLSEQEQEFLEEETVGQEFRFGVQRFRSIDFFDEGTWISEGNGTEVCRLKIRSEGALMLSLQFETFRPERGAKLFVYDENKTEFLGAFTTANQTGNGEWATGVLPGSAIVLEYQRPLTSRSSGSSILISSITHGAVDLFNRAKKTSRDFFSGTSAATCHINVSCPEGANWQQEAAGVAMFLRPDGTTCSGSLLNNAAEDGTPYFYIANHCYQPNAGQWVFYFNYFAPDCTGDTGSTTQSVVGASLLASDFNKDFALVQLNTPPPASYNVSYQGWDRSTIIPDSAIMIGHPQGDVKKLALDADPPTAQSSVNFASIVWYAYWNQGGGEPGSSGSPYINYDRRVQGILSDAYLDCNSNTSITEIGRFSDHWDGPSASSRLRDWLDPNNALITMDAYTPSSNASLELPIKCMLQGPFDQNTGLMHDSLRSKGFLPHSEPYSSLGYDFIVASSGVLASTLAFDYVGSSAIVDWVFVELRSAADPALVVYSDVALLQRNGQVVSTDGVSALEVMIQPGNYFVAIRHRNHLPMMTANPIPVQNGMGLVDFCSNPNQVFGGADAFIQIGSVQCMVMGDVRGDLNLKYVGADNDRDPLLVLLPGALPTSSLTGYYSEDTTLDGVVKYVGQGNDRDPILVNIGGNVPTAFKAASFP